MVIINTSAVEVSIQAVSPGLIRPLSTSAGASGAAARARGTKQQPAAAARGGASDFVIATLRAVPRFNWATVMSAVTASMALQRAGSPCALLCTLLRLASPPFLLRLTGPTCLGHRR